MGLIACWAYQWDSICNPLHFLLVFAHGLVILIGSNKQKRKLRHMGCYILGFTLPACLVIGRNLIISSTFLGATRNPSNIGLQENLLSVFWQTFGGYLGNLEIWMELFWWK